MSKADDDRRRFEAAREEERARQNKRELDAANKAREADAERVRAAKQRLDAENAKKAARDAAAKKQR